PGLRRGSRPGGPERTRPSRPSAAREESWRLDRSCGGANRFPRKGLVKVRRGFTRAEHEQAYDLGVRTAVDDGALRSADTDLFDGDESVELRRTLESDLALAVPAKSWFVDARLPANRLRVEEGDASVFDARRHVRVVPPSVQDVAVDDPDGERTRRLREHGDVLPAASPAPRRLGSNPGRGLHDGLRKFLPWPWIEPASEATSRDIEEQ